MKLYGTITSERASKGQGGNEFLDYILSVGSSKDSREVLKIRAKVYHNEKAEECFAVYGTWHGASEEEKMLHCGVLEKGERKKGECQNRDANGNACWDCECPSGSPCGSTKDE